MCGVRFGSVGWIWSAYSLGCWYYYVSTSFCLEISVFLWLWVRDDILDIPKLCDSDSKIFGRLLTCINSRKVMSQHLVCMKHKQFSTDKSKCETQIFLSRLPWIWKSELLSPDLTSVVFSTVHNVSANSTGSYPIACLIITSPYIRRSFQPWHFIPHVTAADHMSFG